MLSLCHGLDLCATTFLSSVGGQSVVEDEFGCLRVEVRKLE